MPRRVGGGYPRVRRRAGSRSPLIRRDPSILLNREGRGSPIHPVRDVVQADVVAVLPILRRPAAGTELRAVLDPNSVQPLQRVDVEVALLGADLERQQARPGQFEAMLSPTSRADRHQLSAPVPIRGGESFLESPEALSALERFATSSHPIGRQELGQFMSAEDATALTGKALAVVPGMIDPTGGMERGQFGGVIPLPTPPTSFLDLCPSQTLDQPSLPYAQEVSSGDRTAGAAPVSPGQIKPQATIEYKDAEAKPETIASWVKCQKQTLADVDQLTARIQTRLLTGVRAEVENQVLTGDGVSPNLLGLLNVDGTVSVPYDAAAVPPDVILDGIAACLTNGAQPNVVALSIEDWTTILKSKSAGSQEYLGSPFLAPASSLWSLPMVPCAGVPAGQAIVADTRIALTVLWREGVHILISDSDQDDFVRNRATLLAETRVAVAVWVPSAVAIVDLTGTGAGVETSGRGGRRHAEKDA